MGMNVATPMLTRREFVRLSALSGAAAAVTGCATNPVTGRSQFMLISESSEIKLDRDTSPKQFSTDYGVVRDEGLNQYLSSVGGELARHTHRPHMPYSFNPVNAVYCNAYAFPGGSIAVTRGMLAELEDEAQLAALLGHELAHVNYRHTAVQMSQGLLLQLAIAGAGIYLGMRDQERYADLLTSMGGLGAAMYLAKYSREHEREADRTGMDYMARAGYDPGGMVDLMNLLLSLSEGKNAGAIETLFATHPMGSERLNSASHRLAVAFPPADLPHRRNRNEYRAAAGPILKHREDIRLLQHGAEALQDGNLDEARASIENGLSRMPDDYAGLLLLARVAQAQNRAGESEKLARRAAAVYPGEAQSQAVLSRSLFAQRKFEASLAVLKRYDGLLPGDPTVPFYAGLCHERMGQREAAAENYLRFVTMAGAQGAQPPVNHAVSRLKAWGVIQP